MESEKLVAIVTGSAQGIGYAIVKELLIEGFRVCLTDINEQKGNQVAQELKEVYGGSNVTFHTCDVSQKSHYISLFEDVMKTFNRIDVLVNNAGIFNELDLRKTLDINLVGVINGCQVALKYMGKDNAGKGGIVVNVASLAGLLPLPIAPIYAASKHAVVGLTRSYGSNFHYDKSGVIFSALCPHFVNTALLDDVKTSSLMPGLDVLQRDHVMTPTYVARAAIKLIKEKKNGATLAVATEELFGYKYVGLGDLEGVSF